MQAVSNTRRRVAMGLGLHPSDGVAGGAICGGDLMVASQAVGDRHWMAEHRLTAAEHVALVQELETLRARHETELAHRLRDARSFGRSADNDDLLTVLEEAAVDRARIAQLED